MSEEMMDIVRKFVVSLIKALFPNKKALDKITESESGEILYDGKKINGGTPVDIIAHVKKALDELESIGTITINDDTDIISQIKEVLDILNGTVPFDGGSGENDTRDDQQGQESQGNDEQGTGQETGDNNGVDTADEGTDENNQENNNGGTGESTGDTGNSEQDTQSSRESETIEDQSQTGG